MALTRRDFLIGGSAGLLATSCTPVWIDSQLESRERRYGSPLLVVIFLRGGADGLHLVAPLRDPHYSALRGTLALPEILSFTDGFGFHPAFQPLLPSLNEGRVAVVHAAGSPHATRSHFLAQDHMDLGGLDLSHDRKGWLTRLLESADSDAYFTRLSLSHHPPLAYRGSPAFSIDNVARFGRLAASKHAQQVLRTIYGFTDDDPARVAGEIALNASREFKIKKAMLGDSLETPKGLRPRSIRGRVDSLIKLERAGIALRAVFLDVAGWDTHVGQGGIDGRMARSIGDLAEGMQALSDAFRERRELVTVVMTEFGRTVHVNGSGGTDHGHGSVMMVMGNAVRGGVYGAWNGLESDALYQRRDLPVLTDFRSVLSEVARAHLGQPPPVDLFPSFTPQSLGLLG